MTDMDIIIQANSATRDVWIWPAFPVRLPDDSDADDRVALGEVEGLGFSPKFVKSNSGKRLGDLLFTQGSSTKIASQRLVDALTSLGATKFTTFEVEIDHPLINAGDYLGLVVTGQRGVDDLYQLHDYTPHSAVGISPGLLEALRERGVDAFEVGEFDPWYAVERDPANEFDLGDDYDDRTS